MTKKYIVRGDIPKEPAMIIEGQLIVGPGEYYGVSLTADKIKEHIRLTDWTDKFNTSLIYGHRTNTKDKWVGNPSPDDWVGYYTAPEYLSLSDGVDVEGAYSNIYIYDEDLARKLAYGKLKCGVSATFDLAHGGIRNLSVVDNPKVKQAFLNLSDAKGEMELDNVEILSPLYLNLAEVSAMEEKRKSLEMSVSEFYALPMDPPSSSKLPIFDEAHTRNAMARFSQTQFDSAEDRSKAKKKILSAAKKFDIKISEEFLNLSDSPTSERGENSNIRMDNENATKVEEMEKEIADLKAKLAEKEDTHVDVIPEPVNQPAVIPAVTNEPKEDLKPSNESVVITSDKSDAVIEAIGKMAEKITEGLKRPADPQTVAPTNPNQAPISRDDEVTQSLVEKYKSLHGLE